MLSLSILNTRSYYCIEVHQFSRGLYFQILPCVLFVDFHLLVLHAVFMFSACNELISVMWQFELFHDVMF